MVGFCVQRSGTLSLSDATQRLQPMHSRISSNAPFLIFSGRNGSAIEGLAAPMRSNAPDATRASMWSGDVKRPTPTTGLPVTRLTKRM